MWSYQGEAYSRRLVNVVHRGLAQALRVVVERKNDVHYNSEQEEADRIKREEAERVEKERKEAERKRKEQVESERQRVEADRKKREEAERQEAERKKREENVDHIKDFKYVILDDGTIEITKFKGSKIYELVIPESIEGRSVTSIGKEAFSFCVDLTSIKLPEGLTTIGESAFWVCTGLTSIELPDSLTTIEDSAFSTCIHLTSIKIPKSVTQIGKKAFFYCLELTLIVEKDSYTERYAKLNKIRYKYTNA